MECGGVDRGGKVGGGNYTDRFERMQKIEGREECTFWSVVSSCIIVVQNQNQRPENEYNTSSLRNGTSHQTS